MFARSATPLRYAGSFFDKGLLKILGSVGRLTPVRHPSRADEPHTLREMLNLYNILPMIGCARIITYAEGEIHATARRIRMDPIWYRGRTID